MIPDPTQALRRPLFFKLALIFMVTSVTVLSSVGAFFFFQRPRGPRNRERFQKIVNFYFNVLVDRVGNPPDESKARALSKELELQLRIEGPLVNWASSPAVADLNDFEADSPASEAPGVAIGQIHGDTCALMTRGKWRYLLVFPGNPLFSFPTRRVLILSSSIILILGISFLLVRWLLRPISLLVNGVKQISSGNLDYEITLPGGHNEFQNLADAFNHMSLKVREMVKAKERLLIDVSHELRSPLSRVKLALEMMPKTAHQKSITRAASEMDVMLSELLESERLKSSHGALQKIPVFLPELAASVVLNCRGLRPGLKLQKPKKIGSVEADETKALIALKNVIENSLKYSSEQKKAVEVSFSENESSARIIVKDFGIGIPAADLALVFEPFYRVDKSRTKKTGGYGLGLSLCREIMRAHGGDILIQSSAGSGTEVALVFPKN